MLRLPSLTLPSRIRQMARDRAAATFCTFLRAGTTATISYEELYRRSLQYAEKLCALGVRPRDVVLVMLDHSEAMFYAFFGCSIAGAIPSFMPTRTPKQRPELYWADHAALFARIRPRLILTTERHALSCRTILPNLGLELASIDESFKRAEPFDRDFAGFAASPDDTACLQHSSGTTSLKKGVMLAHRTILKQIEDYARTLALTESDRIASWLPLYHDMGFIACFLTSALFGCELVAMDPLEWTLRPRMLLDAIERYRCTLTWLPNFAFSHIVNAVPSGERWNLSSMRAYIDCSEPCKPQTFARFEQRFSECGVTAAQLQVCYAMAENVFAVTQTDLSHPVRTLALTAQASAEGKIEVATPGERAIGVLSCGRCIDGAKVRVCDSAGDELAEETIGEIYIGGDHLFSGYYHLEDITEMKLSNGWYRSGDLGFISDGDLFVTGRADDMLIVNGRNFYAHEIESIVNGVEGIIPGRNVAIAVDGERDATVVIVLGECSQEASAIKIEREVRQRVLESLGLAIHSLRVVSPGQLVKTTSGKLSREKNRALYLDGRLQEAPN